MWDEILMVPFLGIPYLVFTNQVVHRKGLLSWSLPIKDVVWSSPVLAGQKVMHTQGP